MTTCCSEMAELPADVESEPSKDYSLYGQSLSLMDYELHKAMLQEVMEIKQ